MQYTSAACCILFLLVCGTGCEKVIDVKLDNAAKKYVIEGVVTNQPGTCKVLLSQTNQFDDDNEFAGVSGAIVQITEQGGTTIQFTETTTGVYEANLTGAPGKTYELFVNINNQVFTASSTMPQPVNLDSIYATSDETRRGKDRRLMNVQYHDPTDTGNNYRFIQYVNGLKEQQIFVRNDVLTNGNTTEVKLRYTSDDNNENDIQAGDFVKIDMLCIDDAVYKYWYSLNRSATGGGGQMSATPANPVTNIQGGALGYFSAHTLQSKTLVVR